MAELLLPAGSAEAFHAAIEGGADAIYLGLDRFNARGRAKNFTRKQFMAALTLASRNGVKVYLTLNTLVKNEELPDLVELLHFVSQTNTAALIVQDWGVYQIVKMAFPGIVLHVSTQMALHNSVGAEMAGRLGFARAVLARELTLSEIRAVCATRAIDIEVFIHGALCYSLSGHCLFSSWVGGMSANRGLCRQPCRRLYRTDPEGEEEPLFSLRDLELVRHLPALLDAGVASLKIEGRMKPAEYVYRVAHAYRIALDEPARTGEAAGILTQDLARDKTGFFAGGDIAGAISGQTYTGLPLGVVRSPRVDGFTIELRGPVHLGDRLRIQPASGEDSLPVKVDRIISGSVEQESADAGMTVDLVVRGDATDNIGGGDLVLLAGTSTLKFPSRLPEGEVVFPPRIQSQRVTNILAALGADRARPANSRERDELVVRIDSLAWLPKVYPESVDALVLDFTLDDWSEFDATRPGVQRYIDRIVVALPLFIAEANLPFWKENIARLYSAGVRTFMLAQIWQAPLVEGYDGIGVWTAETVYALNDAAIAFLASLGIERFVLPFENDYVNLSRAGNRDGIVPLYFRPRLFISRVPVLGNEESCTDRLGEYTAFVRDGFRHLIPFLPVSLFQHCDRLVECGYNRFLIDLSFEKPSQKTFNRLLARYRDREVEQPSSIFNFKAGLH